MDSVFYPFTVLERILIVPASESTGLSEDKASFYYCLMLWSSCYLQIRYVFLLFVAVFLGFCMKHALHPSKVNNTARHGYSLVCGLMFGLACFGFVWAIWFVCACRRRAHRAPTHSVLYCRQMMCLFAVVGSCYAFLLILSPKVVHRWATSVKI